MLMHELESLLLLLWKDMDKNKQPAEKLEPEAEVYK